MNEQLLKYINIISSYLDWKEGEENLAEIKELFALTDFIEAIKSQRIDTYFESARKHKKDNKRVIDYLLGSLGVLLRNEEAGNENVEYFYFYLKGRRTKTEGKKLVLLMASLVLTVILGYAVSQWHRVDSILLLVAPSKEDICEEAEARYDVEVMKDDIRIESRLNDDYKTNKFYPKKVVYTIPTVIGEEELVFSGTWVPFQELTLDYEMVLVKEYFKAYSLNVTECEMNGSSFKCELDAHIENAESKEVFLQQLEEALEDIFGDTYVTRQFRSYGFSIMLGENLSNGYLYTTIQKDSMAEDLEKLSNELDAQLLESSELMEYLECLE